MSYSKNWSLIYINTYIPLLHLVGFGGQPGYYACKWKHNKYGQAVKLLIRPADKINAPKGDEYPHLTIDFDSKTGDIVWFHYSPAECSPHRVGADEITSFLWSLSPAFREMPVDDMISLLTKR